MPLSSIFLFKNLSEPYLKRIMDAAKEARVKKGHWLFHEGTSADRVYVLKNGAVEMLTRINDDIELPVAIIRNEGGCFGLSALVPPYQYSLSSRCAEDTVVLEINRKDIDKMTQKDPAVGHAIMTNLAQYLLERLKETRQDLKIHFKTLFKSIQT